MKLKIVISFLAFSIAVSFTQAQTTISANTQVFGKWTKAGSPYLIKGNVSVPNGQTLSIEPGVRVEV